MRKKIKISILLTLAAAFLTIPVCAITNSTTESNARTTKAQRPSVLEKNLRDLPGTWDVESVRNTKSGVLVSFDTAQRGEPVKTLFCRTKGSKKEGTYFVLDEWTDTTDVHDLHVNSFIDKTVKNGELWRYKIVRHFENETYDCSNVVTAYYLSQPNNVKITSKHRGKARVSWKKNKKTGGYEVLLSTSKNMSRCVKKRVSSRKTTQKYLSNLKPGKTYYVQVRSYKKIGTKTYYSAKSTVRKIVIAKKK